MATHNSENTSEDDMRCVGGEIETDKSVRITASEDRTKESGADPANLENPESLADGAQLRGQFEQAPDNMKAAAEYECMTASSTIARSAWLTGVACP